MTRNNASAKRPVPTKREMAEALNKDIEQLARRLLGEPNREMSSRSEWRYGTKGSLSVEVGGKTAGKWFDHESNVGGAGFELIVHRMGLDDAAAWDWALEWLGWREDSPLPPRVSTVAASKQEVSQSVPSPEDDESAAKVAGIVQECVAIAGTPAETYLRDVRGITVTPPDNIRFRPKAWGDYGALVALSTDADGKELAVQQVYLTDDGHKAPIAPAPAKRTNKAMDGWSERAAVRFPGTGPVVLCEGVETALSVWQATGRETWACLGVANIGRAPVADGAPVVIAGDGDELDSAADKTVQKAIQRLIERGHAVSVATPTVGKDFNDVLRENGASAVCDAFDRAEPAEPPHVAASSPVAASPHVAAARLPLEAGSDVEIAKRVLEDLTEKFGRIVYAQSKFWRYNKTHWEVIDERSCVRTAVHGYDGEVVKGDGARMSRVKLGRPRIDSVLYECAVLCDDPKFFDEVRQEGINCASGFISFDAVGTATLEPHDPEHRRRHCSPAKWSPGVAFVLPPDSLLATLLDGCFKGDADASEKCGLIQEVCGSAVLGIATRLREPKTAILRGRTAGNGKSQMLDMMRGLLPPDVVSSIPPARMSEGAYAVRLMGKQLNASDELSDKAIASDTFKSVVTGDLIATRDVYQPVVEFRPTPQHVFATNDLPPFTGCFDRGVQRRLMVIEFNRSIPKNERVENIGRRIAAEEADLQLAFAVEGASRLIRQRDFSVLHSSKEALAEWMQEADPVAGWFEECTERDNAAPFYSSKVVYEEFRNWAMEEGYKADRLPQRQKFGQRLASQEGVTPYRTSGVRGVRGFRIVKSTPGWGT